MAFDLQGHRGARGLAPENSLAGFAAAAAAGVTTIELDVGLSRDGAVVIYHDLCLNPAITRDAQGRWLARPGPPVASLTLAELRGYDIGRIRPGSAYGLRFRRQVPRDGERIPTLEEAVRLLRESGPPEIGFNIEVKCSPLHPELTPPAEVMAAAVAREARRLDIAGRATIQSFDWRVPRWVQAHAPDLATAFLTTGRGRSATVRRDPSPWLAGFSLAAAGGSVPRLVRMAGGRLWTPDHRDLDAAAIAEAQALGLRVIAWTVNSPRRMRRLVAAGIDGLITDYPDRLRRVLGAR